MDTLSVVIERRSELAYINVITDDDEESKETPWYQPIINYKTNVEYPPNTDKRCKRALRLLASQFVLEMGQLLKKTPQVILQAISWVAIVILSSSSISISTMTFYLLLGNLGASLAEVANDAIVSEMSKQPTSMKKGKAYSSGELQSSVWMALSLAARSLNLPKNRLTGGIKQQLADLASALRKPEIAYQIAWLSTSSALVPVFSGTMLKSASPRKVISAIQVTMAVFMVSDVLFVNKFYQQIGIPDSVYVVVFLGLLDGLFFFNVLPFSVFIAQLCPAGCEGSLMAFLMSAISLAMIVAGYFGMELASVVGVIRSDSSGLPRCLLIQVACAVIPLLYSSWIPDKITPKVTKKDS
ncbi:hypothetical protein RND81_12G047900 [Saponaria officinalis]|uniref:Uncharacterized protein n=1 Tax=Saponaria officinalis TaxID=3572 RepID=A0AAW1H4Y3_SAPOF